MSDDLQSAASSLSDQTKKLDIAAFYTHGDMEKAKQMVAGTYKDIYAIKARFSSATIHGGFIIFFNYIFNTVHSVYEITSLSDSPGKMKTNQKWKEFEAEMSSLRENEDHDVVTGKKLNDKLTSAFTISFCRDLKKLMELKDEIAINRFFQKFIKDTMSFQNVDMSVDMEQTSSLEVEFNSTTSKKIGAKELMKGDDEITDGSDIESESDEDVLQGKVVKLILQGSVVLSPIKGKDISLVKAGDRIRIRVLDNHPKAKQVARAFNALDEEGNIRPIPGRIVDIKHRSQGGYKIFAIVAKGIFVRIEEEEETIKVALEQPGSAKSLDDESSSKKNVILIIVLVVVFLSLIGVLLMFFL